LRNQPEFDPVITVFWSPSGGLIAGQHQNGEQEMTDTEVTAESPCMGDCMPDEEGICQSCFLSTEENDRWNHISNEERLVIVRNTQERKKAKTGG
jgi:predicted Fe-S protein YdhL (DUF1289 family)